MHLYILQIVLVIWIDKIRKTSIRLSLEDLVNDKKKSTSWFSNQLSTFKNIINQKKKKITVTQCKGKKTNSLAIRKIDSCHLSDVYISYTDSLFNKEKSIIVNECIDKIFRNSNLNFTMWIKMLLFYQFFISFWQNVFYSFVV